MLWLKIAAGTAAAVLVSIDTRAGVSVGQMKPDRLFLVLVLLSIAFM